MKLTTKSEYCILGLIYMARWEARASEDSKNVESYTKIEQICEKYDIPKKYLELLFGILKQSGYIKAKRGSSGGYRLAKRADEISLAEIIRLMDGALAPTESVSRYFFSTTPLSKEVGVTAVFKDIRDYIADKLEGVKLADFV